MLKHTALIAATVYVTAVFVMYCARPAPAEDSCADPTLAVIALPELIQESTGLGVVCFYEGIH